jgi:hypothetical protein
MIDLYKKRSNSMLRHGLCSFNFLMLITEKNAFLVRYGSPQIAFVTQNPSKPGVPT